MEYMRFSGSSWSDWVNSTHRTTSIPYAHTATSGSTVISVTRYDWPHYGSVDLYLENYLPDELFEIPVLIKGE